MGYNRCVFEGYVARELKVVEKDSSTLVSTSIAVNSKFKEKEEVMFLEIVAFGKVATIMKEYVKKGSHIIIDGRLKQEKWSENDVNRSAHKLIVGDLRLLDKKEDLSN